MISQRASGVTMSCSSVPVSRSRTMESAVTMMRMLERIMPMMPGTMNTALRSAGLKSGRYVQMTTVLVTGHFVFHVPVRGPLLALYAATFLFIVANLGLGLFISTLGRHQAQVTQTAFLFLLPNVLLSGFMFPREAMPAAARVFGLVLPLTFYLQLIRGIVLKGNGLTQLWPQALALAAFALAFFTFATWRFSKTLE